MKLPLERHVCNLTISKRLRDLGVSQDTIWGWYDKRDLTIRGKGKTEYYLAIIVHEGLIPNSHADGVKSLICAAPDSSELGEMLPPKIKKGEKYYRIWGIKGINCYEVKLLSMEERYDEIYYTTDYTEADARAKMLIYLLENKIITVEEVNKRI